MSTSECSSGCESGWTTYLDQSSNSADQYPKADSDKNHWSRGVNVNEEGEEDEDEDLSMVSDASSGPRNFHEEENCLVDRGYFSYAASGSEQVKMSKQKKKIKENRAYLDDTASSPVLSFSEKVPNNQVSSMEKETKGFSETHSKGKSSTLKKKFGLLKSSVSGKSSSEKSGGSQGRKW